MICDRPGCSLGDRTRQKVREYAEGHGRKKKNWFFDGLRSFGLPRTLKQSKDLPGIRPTRIN